MKIRLDLKPLSINQCWQGKRYFTPKGKEFRELCLRLIPKKKQLTGLLGIEIIVHLKKAWLKSDVDNFLKPLLDAIVEKGLVEDDRFFTDLTIRKRSAKKDYVEIKIWQI